MNRLGKRGKDWERVKRQIKPKFEALGITSCENCGGTHILQWAHARKRRFLLAGELKVCALLCQKCHSQFESMSHESMHENVMRIIFKRAVQPVEIPDTAQYFHLDPKLRSGDIGAYSA